MVDTVLQKASAEWQKDANIDIDQTEARAKQLVQDWTEEEEKKVKRNTLTSSILEDLHINTDDINAGTMLFNVGIIVFEIPSNIILQIVGPREWLSGQALAWALVATFQAFITNYHSFMATRFLLGLCESGFIPGALFYLGTWHKKNEMSLRIAIYFLGQNLSTAIGRLLAAGILTPEGAHGMAGWRWMFLIEGITSITVAVLFVLIIPPHVGNGKALIFMGKKSYFSERESHILTQRIRIDSPENVTEKKTLTVKGVVAALTRPTIWAHVAITFLSTCSYNGLGTYTTKIIKSMGFSPINSNLLSYVSAYFCCAINLLLAYLADRTGHRGTFVLFGAAWDLISYACLNTVVDMTNVWKKYWALMMANVTFSTVHLLVMGANTGAIAGANVLCNDDAPLYRRAFRSVTYIASADVDLIILLGLYYLWKRKRTDKAPAPTVVA